MSAVETAGAAATLLAEPHHDGSDLFVRELPDKLGGDAVLRLRAPRDARPRGAEGDPVSGRASAALPPTLPTPGSVALRYVRDGEPQFAVAHVDEETETDTWWRATLPVANPVTRYRWVVPGASVNALGAGPYEVPDSGDFMLTLGAGGPDWHLESVVYEIFPDRFSSSGLGVEPPEWVVPRAWDDLPTGRGFATPREWFGGDLPGIAARLGHLEALGVNAIYLTPIFPAGSTHRYDARSFDRVDPLLGGEEGFAALVEAARARGIRLLGDLTLNHCGNEHDWFRAAREGKREREFFYFDESLPHGYEAWFGVRTLPKLDWRSEELRQRMLDVLSRWLDAGLDGWRIDVANMIGRFREIDLNQDVARLVRGAIRRDELLIAEHGHDFRPDLDGRGWQGTMNYAGFLRPVWSWLRAPELPTVLEDSFWGAPFGLAHADGVETVARMRAFRAGLPWESTLHSWPLLDSHDTARFRSVSGSRAAHVVGIGLQMTTPGVPMVFAGDELGLEGAWGEDARRTMPWDRPEDWDRELLDAYRRLIALRRGSRALQRGGIRYVHASADAIAYLRETGDERLLCLAARARHIAIHVPFRSLETLHGEDAVDGVLPDGGPAFHVWRIHG